MTIVYSYVNTSYLRDKLLEWSKCIQQVCQRIAFGLFQIQKRNSTNSIIIKVDDLLYEWVCLFLSISKKHRISAMYIHTYTKLTFHILKIPIRDGWKVEADDFFYRNQIDIGDDALRADHRISLIKNERYSRNFGRSRLRF